MASIFPMFSKLLSQVSQACQSIKAGVAWSSSSSSSKIEKEISAIINDLESVKRASAWIRAAIKDAEERAIRGENLVQEWLTDLHHLAYRASDLVGLYEYEVIAQEVRGRDQEAQKAPGHPTACKRKIENLYQVHDSSPLSDPSFRQEFASAIRQFREKFDEINKLKEDLRFDKEDGEKISRTSSDMMEHQPTGSEPVDDEFFGRETKLQELIELLLNDDIEQNGSNNESTPLVIALTGMGGVGKTTLAQHAFNDAKVCNHYSKKGWVCVSDDFNVLRLTRRTLEALEVFLPPSEEFSVLQDRLKGVVRQNKFLLILDDVWNESQQAWDTFYSSLKHGARGSKIIVTTRSETVARAAKAKQNIDVCCLAEEDAWTLFQMFAFGNHVDCGQAEHPALLTIGKKITEKCKGLPLAVKVLGRYLRYEEKKEETWNDVLASDLWEPHMWAEGKQVLGPLTLSYLHLPEHLKPCFVISAAFPKDSPMDRKELIKFWMAHDLIDDNNKDIGIRYLENLVLRSFFIRQRDDDVVMMHDLIHDLAQFLSKDRMLHWHSGDENDKDFGMFHHIHGFGGSQYSVYHVPSNFGSLRTLNMHSSTISFSYHKHVKLQGLRVLKLTDSKFDGGALSDYLKGLENLRELSLDLCQLEKFEMDAICSLYNLRALTIVNDSTIFVPESIGNLRHLVELEISGLSNLPDSIGYLTKLRRLKLERLDISSPPCTISKLVNLKELDLRDSKIVALPESIGNLRALQVLDLKDSKIVALPESIGNLRALQVLDLSGCWKLERIPRNLVNLTNLTSIDLEESYEGHLPIGFGGLQKLKDLSFFWVPPVEAPQQYAGIEELRDLSDIRGCLRISGLKNVVKQEDAVHANLKNKKYLTYLYLQWGPFDDGDEEEEEEEEEATISMDERVLEGLTAHINIARVDVDGWRGRQLASWLGNESFVNLERVGLYDLPNCTSLRPLHLLPSLESLYCSRMPSLVNLIPSFLDSDWETMNNCFPMIRYLQLRECPRLATCADVRRNNPSLVLIGMDVRVTGFGSVWLARD